MSTVATSTTNESAPVVFPFRPWRMTVAEYHELIRNGGLKDNNRFEMLKGVLAEKMTHNPPHAAFVGIVRRLIEAILPAGFIARIQVPITLADSEPEPDLAIVRGDEADYLERHPEPADIGLVIEIGVSSLLTDRYKSEIYAEAGIPQYWIVDPINRQVESYSNPQPTVAGLRYADCQRIQPGDSIAVIIAGQEIGNLPAARLLHVVS